MTTATTIAALWLASLLLTMWGTAWITKGKMSGVYREKANRVLGSHELEIRCKDKKIESLERSHAELHESAILTKEKLETERRLHKEVLVDAHSRLADIVSDIWDKIEHREKADRMRAAGGIYLDPLPDNKAEEGQLSKEKCQEPITGNGPLQATTVRKMADWVADWRQV